MPGGERAVRASPPDGRPPEGAPTPPSPVPTLDTEGRFHRHGAIAYTVVGAYVFLLVLVVAVVLPTSGASYLWVPILLIAVTLLFLARYVSTYYTIDDTYLRARRILGGRTIRLEEVRRIEYASLRDLVPVSAGIGMGAWGWRGRLYSPTIGEFDSIYTEAAKGLLVTAGAYPLYISPRDPAEFARELSRRVRSYTGPLTRDVGDPSQASLPQ